MDADSRRGLRCCVQSHPWRAGFRALIRPTLLPHFPDIPCSLRPVDAAQSHSFVRAGEGWRAVSHADRHAEGAGVYAVGDSCVVLRDRKHSRRAAICRHQKRVAGHRLEDGTHGRRCDHRHAGVKDGSGPHRWLHYLSRLAGPATGAGGFAQAHAGDGEWREHLSRRVVRQHLRIARRPLRAGAASGGRVELSRRVGGYLRRTTPTFRFR